MALRMQTIDERITKYNQGQLVEQSLPLLLRELDKQSRAIDKQVFRKLRNNEILHPEIAVQMWVQKYAYEQVRTRLTQLVNVGDTASEELTEVMNTEGES